MFNVAPHIVVRINNMPIHLLEGLSQNQLRINLRKLHKYYMWKKKHKDDVLSELFSKIGGMPQGNEKRQLIKLQRDIFNDKTEKITDSILNIETSSENIHVWCSVQNKYIELYNSIIKSVDQVLNHERQWMQDVCKDEIFQSAVAFSSLSLLEKVNKYTHTSIQNQRKQLRKSEPTLINYILRAISKVSPFSYYTSVGYGSLDSSADNSGKAKIGNERTSKITVSHTVIRRILDYLCRDPKVYENLCVREPILHHVENGKLIFKSFYDDPLRQPRVFKTSEMVKSLNYSKAVQVLISQLKESSTNKMTFKELCDQWYGKFGMENIDQVRTFLEDAVNIGLIVLEQPVPDQVKDILKESIDFLDLIQNEESEKIKNNFYEVRELILSTSSSKLSEKKKLLSDCINNMKQIMDNSGIVSSRTTWIYEDTVINQNIKLNKEIWKKPLGDLAKVMNILENFDTNILLRTIIRDTFIESHGVGNSISFLKFTELIPIIISRWNKRFKERYGYEETPNQYMLEDIMTKRKKLVDYLIHQLNKDSIEVEVDLNVFEQEELESNSNYPEWASYSVFIQAQNINENVNNIVVNHIYGGLGQYASRFLDMFNDECTNNLREHTRSLFPENWDVCEIRPECGFNANLHKLIAEKEIDYSGRLSDGIKLENINVRHNQQTNKLELLNKKNNRRLEVLYLGLLIPYLLPEHIMILSVMAGGGQINLPIHEIYLQKKEMNIDSIINFPRVKFGSVVLFRRTWLIVRTYFPQRLSGEAFEVYFIRLNLWRMNNKLPSQVFVREMQFENTGTETNSYDDWRLNILYSDKPQYFDFESPICVRLIEKWLKDHTGNIRVEEIFPALEEQGAFSSKGEHTMEIIVQFDRGLKK